MIPRIHAMSSWRTTFGGQGVAVIRGQYPALNVARVSKRHTPAEPVEPA
jgi:hypothetical protein